ncbi:MAG: hypothetical protein K6C40_09525 [Thermoguttaceae bacterium]|nr:hypothetical protein [Thermoguttaceae bacterium]
MNEEDFEFQNVKPLEPWAKLRFSTLDQLEKHVHKHVIGTKDEKWRLLEGFDSTLIHKIKSEDRIFKSAEFKKLAWKYMDTISECAFAACSKGKDHFHQIAYYPKLTRNLFYSDDPGLVQYIKILGFSKKIVIILASFVKNGIPQRYIIMTAFRVFPELKGKSWKKQAMKALQEKDDLRNGRKYRLIADHMETNNDDMDEV